MRCRLEQLQHAPAQRARPLALATLATSWLVGAAPPPVGASAAPSFDCTRARGAVEQLICSDAELAALDRRLAQIYTQAAARAAGGSGMSALRARQRRWIRTRNACEVQADLHACVRASYDDRTVELRVEWHFVPVGPRARFVCDGPRGGRLTATYYETDPAAVRLRRDGQSVLALRRPAGGGARYEGPDVVFVVMGERAGLVWQGAALTCSTVH